MKYYGSTDRTMNHDTDPLRELEATSARLTPHVRRGCDSVPSPDVLAAIRTAATRQAGAPRILPFVPWAIAAAATLLVLLSGWTLFRVRQATEVARQATLMDDMLFLCAEASVVPETIAPGAQREERARRLLNLQGLGEAAAPATKVSAESEELPSTVSQSHNTRELQAQRCG